MCNLWETSETQELPLLFCESKIVLNFFEVLFQGSGIVVTCVHPLQAVVLLCNLLHSTVDSILLLLLLLSRFSPVRLCATP